MTESDVFWLGKRSPSGEQCNNFADQPEFAASIENACEALGCRVRRFVSAKGPYGTWLVEFEFSGRKQRIVWNGKEQKLLLQIAVTGGRWEEPNSTMIASTDLEGFIEGMHMLMGSDIQREA